MTTPTRQTTIIRGGRLLDARAHRADPGDILVRFLRGRGMKTGWGVVGVLSFFCLVSVAQAQPSDQVSGMGGSVKRGIGMKDIYEAARERSQQKR